MFFDLCFSVPTPASLPQISAQPSKKNKGKQQAAAQSQKNSNTSSSSNTAAQGVKFSPAQIERIESRIDLLVRLGYNVIALNQDVKSKVEQKTHVNILDPLLKQLRPRKDIIFLKRLTLLLDEESEKGTGMSQANTPLFTPYDILAVQPSSQTTLQSACLTLSQPSPLTAHIISLPLTDPRPPFRIKHTLVRTALKNGAVFEITYSGALTQAEDERRNWWAAARELTRVTKGKGIVASSGVDRETSLRAPRDVQNLITLLGVAQNQAHDMLTVTPKSMLVRAQTRKTYRAILSEPVLVTPPSAMDIEKQDTASEESIPPKPAAAQPSSSETAPTNTQNASSTPASQSTTVPPDNPPNGRKRRSESMSTDEKTQAQAANSNLSKRQKKKMRLANKS